MEAQGSEPLATVEAVAKAYNVSPRTVYRLAKAEKIPAYRVGRSIRFNLREVGEALRVAA